MALGDGADKAGNIRWSIQWDGVKKEYSKEERDRWRKGERKRKKERAGGEKEKEQGKSRVSIFEGSITVDRIQ